MGARALRIILPPSGLNDGFRGDGTPGACGCTWLNQALNRSFLALEITERRTDTSGSAATATAGALVRALLRGEQRRPAAVGGEGVSGPRREGRGGARRER